MKIQRDGFRPSPSGMLGKGVYVTTAVHKAMNYAEPKKYKGVIFTLKVANLGECKKMKKGDPMLQKRHQNNFDSAYSAAGVNGQREENCIWDPKRIQIVSVNPVDARLAHNAGYCIKEDGKLCRDGRGGGRGWGSPSPPARRTTAGARYAAESITRSCVLLAFVFAAVYGVTNNWTIRKHLSVFAVTFAFVSYFIAPLVVKGEEYVDDTVNYVQNAIAVVKNRVVDFMTYTAKCLKYTKLYARAAKETILESAGKMLLMCSCFWLLIYAVFCHTSGPILALIIILLLCGSSWKIADKIQYALAKIQVEATCHPRKIDAAPSSAEVQVRNGKVSSFHSRRWQQW